MQSLESFSREHDSLVVVVVLEGQRHINELEREDAWKLKKQWMFSRTVKGPDCTLVLIGLKSLRCCCNPNTTSLLC